MLQSGIGTSGVIEKPLLIFFLKYSCLVDSLPVLLFGSWKAFVLHYFVSAVYVRPWIIERILYGHLMLYFGYFVMPLVIALTISSLDLEKPRHPLVDGLCLIRFRNISAH